MSRSIVFRSVAKQEFDEAVTWYESELVGLGWEFKEAVDQALTLVANQPALFRPVRGSIRRAILRRFPYAIYFVEEPGRLVVLAVFHGSRDPKNLHGR